MKRAWVALMALLGGLADAPLAVAQADPRTDLLYPRQQRVRVTAPSLFGQRVDGRVATVDSAHLILTLTPAGTRILLPLASIGAIEAFGGVSRRRGMRRGALVGFGVGAYFFLTEYPEIREHDYFGVGALAMGLISFAIAPGIGAAVGYALAPDDWSALPVPAPTAAAPATASIRFAADEHIRLRTRGATLSGRVHSQTRTLVTVSTDDAAVPVPWADVQRVRVRGGKDRWKGALAGALVGIGIGILGEQSAPTTSTRERVSAFAGSALVFGYLGSRWLAPRGWTDLPVPRTTP